MCSYGSPIMAGQKQDDQLEHTFSSHVRIWDVVLKTCRRWWTIGRSGKRGSGISVLTAQHDDDDEICIYSNNRIKRSYHCILLFILYNNSIIRMLHCQHGSPWPSLTTCLYRPLLLGSLQGYILYQHRAVIHMILKDIYKKVNEECNHNIGFENTLKMDKIIMSMAS